MRWRRSMRSSSGTSTRKGRTSVRAVGVSTWVMVFSLLLPSRSPRGEPAGLITAPALREMLRSAQLTSLLPLVLDRFGAYQGGVARALKRACVKYERPRVEGRSRPRCRGTILALEWVLSRPD